MGIATHNRPRLRAAALAICVPLLTAAPATPIVPFADTGDLFVLDRGNSSVVRIDSNGVPTVAVSQAEIVGINGGSSPTFADTGIAFDAAGNMYFADANQDNIYKRTPNGALTILVAGADLAAASATGSEARPEGLAFGSDGQLYVVDDNNNTVLRVDPDSGAASLFRSNAQLLALKAAGATSFNPESGIIGTPDGKIYVADEGGTEPRGVVELDIANSANDGLLTSGGEITGSPHFMTRGPTGDLFLADPNSATSIDQILRIDPDTGDVTVFLDEAQIIAAVGDPLVTNISPDAGIAFDDAGNFYLAEELSDSILRWDVDDFALGTIDTASGSVFTSRAALEAAFGIGGNTIRLDAGIAFAPFIESAAVPEPTGRGLFATALNGLGWARRRRVTA